MTIEFIPVLVLGLLAGVALTSSRFQRWVTNADAREKLEELKRKQKR